MKKTIYGLFALALAALFGTVLCGPSEAFARPMPKAQNSSSNSGYHIRKLPGLTAPAKKKAKKKPINKSFLKHEAFLGKIAKKNGHYVLTAGIFSYKLSNQAEAKKYKGENVKVIGKLNPQTNKITVKQIKKAGA